MTEMKAIKAIGHTTNITIWIFNKHAKTFGFQMHKILVKIFKLHQTPAISQRFWLNPLLLLFHSFSLKLSPNFLPIKSIFQKNIAQ